MKINNSYVKAIYDLSLEINNLEQILNISKQILEQIEDNPKLVKYLSDFSIEKTEKKTFIYQIIPNKALANWFLILIDDKQIFSLKEYLQAFIKKYNENHDILEGTIWTTEPLSKITHDEVAILFSKKLSKKVFLKSKIDNELIGGIKVEINGLTWDNTLKGQLNNLVEELILNKEKK